MYVFSRGVALVSIQSPRKGPTKVSSALGLSVSVPGSDCKCRQAFLTQLEVVGLLVFIAVHLLHCHYGLLKTGVHFSIKNWKQGKLFSLKPKVLYTVANNW